ncbi:hypothetical protein IRJ41_019326, partial [Triplophysa rosa]
EKKVCVIQTSTVPSSPSTATHWYMLGWHLITADVTTRPTPPPMESAAGEIPAGHSHPRQPQPDSRCALSAGHAPRRVATPPPRSSSLGAGRVGTGGPVCLPGHRPLPTLVLPYRGSPRHGGLSAQRATGQVEVRLPPSEPPCTDPVQGQGRGASSPASCAGKILRVVRHSFSHAPPSTTFTCTSSPRHYGLSQYASLSVLVSLWTCHQKQPKYCSKSKFTSSQWHYYRIPDLLKMDYLRLNISPEDNLRYHLSQDGRPLERYVEDFITLSHQVNWDNRWDWMMTPIGVWHLSSGTDKWLSLLILSGG